MDTNVIKQPLKFKHIPYAKKEKRLPQPLEKEEVLAILNVCKNTKHKVILYLLYGCGLRVQELLDLKWKDIDRAAGVCQTRLQGNPLRSGNQTDGLK